jgi:maleate cis-trans isomerase
MGMFGWSYPPGVTGNEYEIAGPDYEQEEKRACGQRDVVWHVVSSAGASAVALLVTQLRKVVLDASGVEELRKLYSTALLAEGVDEVAFEVCPFDGEVLVQGFRGKRWWRCPGCGTEHEADD